MTADQKLKQIQAMLFPPLVMGEEEHPTEGTIKYLVDYSVDSNLQAVLFDLQEGVNNDVTQDSLQKILKVVSDIRKLLDVDQKVDPNFTFLVVEPPVVGDIIQEINDLID